MALARSGRAGAEPPRVVVRGSPRIEVRASYEEGRLVLAGRVVDDAGAPVRSDGLRLTLQSLPASADGGAGEVVSLEGRIDGCSTVRGGTARASGDGAAIATGELGAFCVRIVMAPSPVRAELTLAEGPLHEAASTSIVYNGALQGVALDFEPQPHRLPLDSPSAVFDVVAHYEGRGGTAPAPGLALRASDERGTELGAAVTGAGGRATFTVPTALLAGPGPGALRVEFAGSSTASPATLVADVERESRVVVDVTAEDGKLAPAYPDEGVPIAAVVTTARGPVTGGVVQALLGQTVVGAAAVEGGRAELVAVFSAPRASVADIRLHYVPDAPWHVPGRDRIVTVPVLRESPWRNVPLALAGLALFVWMVAGRTRRKSELRLARVGLKTPPPPHAEVEVLRPARGRSEGWRGVVRDAHDGEPLAGAVVRIERPSFTGHTVLARAESDGDGAFVLAPTVVRPGDELVAEARLHAELRKAVPPGGELRISLVERRRAVLERLVRWARRRGLGGGGDGHKEPTPQEVSAAAGSEAVASWAEAVERAAFSGAEVTREEEASVDALAPREGGAPSARPKR